MKKLVKCISNDCFTNYKWLVGLSALGFILLAVSITSHDSPMPLFNITNDGFYKFFNTTMLLIFFFGIGFYAVLKKKDNNDERK